MVGSLTATVRPSYWLPSCRLTFAPLPGNENEKLGFSFFNLLTRFLSNGKYVRGLRTSEFWRRTYRRALASEFRKIRADTDGITLT
ncbi:unnamed protein product [Cochlearia groenlandica]